jgi:CheY-like chemotaxis protein
MMPDKTGFEVLEILKSDLSTAAIPVVMFAGVDEEEAKLRAAEGYSEG